MKAQSCCIPQRKITPNGTKQPEWFNKSIAEAISNRQKAYNISKLRPSPETKVAPIKECRNVDKLIRRAKLNEEDRVAAAAKDNPKAFFAHVNSRKPVKNTIGPLKDRTGSIISSDEGMANILNEYFTSVYTEEDTSEIPIIPIVYRGNVQFDQKFTFEAHLRATSSLIAQKLGLLRKSFKIFNDQSILRKCFYSFILPCFEYCSPVWSSAADSHLRLLDRNLNACKVLIPDLIIDLWHRRSISSLCMLYKIFHNPEHPLHSELPNLFQPVRMTRNVANSHSLSFCPVRCNTVQYSRSFIPAFVKSWNDLPEEVVECSELQRFKTGANRFLLNLQI